MVSDLPPPPVPPDADLRHFHDMPVDVVRLRGSDLAARGDPADNWYAFLLWGAAFHQQPAGSLPVDDKSLAYLAGFGRNLRLWHKHKKGALHGWFECSDGRQYHPTVSRKVLECLTKSKAGRVGAAAKWGRDIPQDTDKQQNSECDRNAPIHPVAMPRREGNRIEGNIPPLTPPPADEGRPPELSFLDDFSSGVAREKSVDRPKLMEEFKLWYETYPLHVGRAVAEKAFVKARKLAAFEILLAGATRYRAKRQREDGHDPDRLRRFSAHPSTWLNEKRWLDEEPEPAISSGYDVDAHYRKLGIDL